MATIYCDVRNPRFDEAIKGYMDAGHRAKNLARVYHCSKSTIYRAKKRAESLKYFCLRLRGDGVALPIGMFAAQSFESAAKGALRHFDALGALELAEWEIAASTGERVRVLDLKDAGKSARHRRG